MPYAYAEREEREREGEERERETDRERQRYTKAYIFSFTHIYIRTCRAREGEGEGERERERERQKQRQRQRHKQRQSQSDKHSNKFAGHYGADVGTLLQQQQGFPNRGAVACVLRTLPAKWPPVYRGCCVDVDEEGHGWRASLAAASRNSGLLSLQDVQGPQRHPEPPRSRRTACCSRRSIQS